MKFDRVNILFFAIMFFVVFDMISTMCALSYLGSYEYESSNFIKNILMNYGVIGFVIAKSIIGFIVLWITYKLHFDYILTGSIFAGLYVGISNFKIPLTGYSLWFFGLNSQIISICLIVLPCLIQIMQNLDNFSKKGLTRFEENLVDKNMIKYSKVLKELEK